jgi:hypothetical protein
MHANSVALGPADLSFLLCSKPVFVLPSFDKEGSSGHRRLRGGSTGPEKASPVEMF